jgi:hypothetical protein
VEKNTSTAYVEPTGLIAGALAPTGEAGSSLFLINLCASMAPVQLANKTLPGLENYRLYQVTRVEDGRTRYRLRLGFFATEAEAEDVLATVREQYPTAFTACLAEEDRRHTRGYVVKAAPAKSQMSVVRSNPAKPAVAKAAAQPAAKPAAAPKAAAAAPKPQAQVAAKSAAPSAADIISVDDLSWDPPALDTKRETPKPSAAANGKHQTLAPGFKTQPVIKAEPAKAKNTAPATTPKAEPKIDTAASMRVPAVELTLSDPPAPVAQPKPRSAPNEPFHVGKGVEIPTTQLSLQTDQVASAKPVAPTTTAPQAAATPHKVGSSAAAKVTAKAATLPTKPAAAPAAIKPAPKAPASIPKHPDLDSTQTIRALTSDELNDEMQEKWFAIQLAASEQPVNLDTMPHLDIFEAYRLYSVATAGSGKIVHSLRLGFFKEAVSAEAVAGYLKTFFSSPSVLRISVAEQARFKDATMPKKPDPEVRAQANVIELDSARASRVPTVTMEVVPPPSADTSATGSFKVNSTGSFRTSDTAKHRTLGTVKPAAKTAAPATKRSPPIPSKKSSTTGKYKMPIKKSLAEQLLDEAKEVELSESGIYKMPKNDSLLSRLVDKLKK